MLDQKKPDVLRMVASIACLFGQALLDVRDADVVWGTVGSREFLLHLTLPS